MSRNSYLIERLSADLRHAISQTLNQTDKEIHKGILTCNGCDFKRERKIDDIYQLVDEAVIHAKTARIGQIEFDHHAGFNVNLIPVPEPVDEIDAKVKVGKEI